MRSRAFAVLGDAARADKDDAAAEKNYRAGMVLTSDSDSLALKLGVLLTEEKRFREAESILQTAYQRMQRTMPPDAPILSRARDALATLRERWNKPDKVTAIRNEQRWQTNKN